MADVVARVASPRYVGRVAELEAFRHALARLHEPGGHVVLVTGEAGIGKSRFLAEAHAAMVPGTPALGPVRWLAGACLDLAGTAIPFAPIFDVLEAAGSLDDDVQAAADDLIDDLSGGGSVDPGEAWGGAGRSRRFRRIRDLLTGISSTRDLVVAIDDLHWADPSTMDIVRFLARSWRQQPVALVLAYRSDELHRRHPLRPLIADLERVDVMERIELSRLPGGEVDDLVEAIAGPGPDPRLRERIHRLADGNPFHIEELVAASGDLDGSPTLRSVLAIRLGRLSDDARAATGAAAVTGRDADEPTLAAVSGLDGPVVRAALGEAVEAGILVVTPDGLGYRFRHALMREAIDDELLPGERVDLHRRAAAHLASLPRPWNVGALMERAHHLSVGQVDADARAAFIEAGKAAEAAHAWTEAAGAYERALQLADPARTSGLDRTVDLLMAAARTGYLTGRPARALALLEQAMELGDREPDPSRDGELRTMAAYMAAEIGDRSRMMHLARAAYEITPNEDTAVRARVLETYGGAHMQEGLDRASIELTTTAIDLARRLGHAPIVLSGHSVRAIAHAGLGHEAEALADLDAAGALADRDDPDGMALVVVNRTAVLGELGHLEAQRASALEGLSIAAREGLDESWVPWLAPMAADASFWLGRWDEAARLLGADLDVDLPTSSPQRLMRARTEAALAAARGDPAAPARAASVAVAANGLGMPDTTAEVRFAAALGHLWFEDPDASVEQVRQGLADLEGVESIHPRELLLATGLRASADLADRSRARGHDVPDALVDAARGWLIDLRSLADGSHVEGARGTRLARWAEAMGRPELERLLGLDTAGSWTEAIDHSDALPAPLFAAYARYRAGGAAVRDGDRATAADLLRASRASATSLGAAPLLQSIDGLARRARMRLRDDPGPGDDAAPTVPARPWGLSVRELEVLALVADGRTNRQIGEALFISEKTASVHVTHILDKLGVDSRIEAALLAGRAGVFDAAPSRSPGG